MEEKKKQDRQEQIQLPKGREEKDVDDLIFVDQRWLASDR